MLASLQNQSFEKTPDSAEVIIVNTCALLTEASEESIKRILELSDFKSTGSCESLSQQVVWLLNATRTVSRSWFQNWMDCFVQTNLNRFRNLCTQCMRVPDKQNLIWSKNLTTDNLKNRPVYKLHLVIIHTLKCKGLFQHLFVLQHSCVKRKFQ